MTALQLVPVTLSLLVLGAHFLRSGHTLLMAWTLLILALLFVRKPWTARLAQAVLVLGALEWVRTVVHLVGARAQAGVPVVRMTAILVAVALVTGLSALLFQTRSLGRTYGIRPE